MIAGVEVFFAMRREGSFVFFGEPSSAECTLPRRLAGLVDEKIVSFSSLLLTYSTGARPCH